MPASFGPANDGISVRAKTMQKTLSLVLLKVNKGTGKNPDMAAVCSATAKALSRRLRPTDSIFVFPRTFSAWCCRKPTP